ncbi:hypothetical protein QC761_0080870 [Podospora bellae-mahoneyi]|uniref:Uncharacterized protein n=1 Tax=Podospora bellae-mahoneyi TaxID=2093777 RepID=A0ABR0FGR5_9PEZI|nr:hypothetical protein QC761_0080870 [Podospora bellae-mahoneyi]
MPNNSIAVPETISKVSVSTVKFGPFGYISGLRLGFGGFHLVSIAAVLKDNVNTSNDDSSDNDMANADRPLKDLGLW